MDWLFWLGTTVLVVTVVGLLYLRNRPIYDLDGNPVDRDGLRVPTYDRLVCRILIELLDADATTSAYVLRLRVRLSGPLFYSLMGRLERDELVESREVTGLDTTFPSSRGYRLTDRGLTEARRLTTGRR